MNKIKLYKLYRKGATKWGDTRPLLVSFQKLSNYCAFLGDGLTEGVLGWGITKMQAAENLLKNLSLIPVHILRLEETEDNNMENYSNFTILKDRIETLYEKE